MQALDILRSKLLGSFISRFSVGDTWDLYINGYWLVAQDVLSEDENFLNKLLEENYSYFNNTTDKEYISKSAIVTAAMRREIVNVELDSICNLEIEFDNKLKLIVPADTDSVDWQWCLNETGADPYRDYLVACFWKSEIQINQVF